MLYTLWKTPSLLYLLEGMRTFKFCSLNTFQLYKTVLSAKVIILYNGSTGVTYLATESLYLLTKLSLFLPPLFSSLFLWVCFFFFLVHMVSGTMLICLSLCCSVAQSCLTLCNPMDCRTPTSPDLHYLPEFSQSHVHWIINASNPLILCCPLLLLSSIFASIRVFFNELALCIRWPKYWSFSFSISLSNEYSW